TAITSCADELEIPGAFQVAPAANIPGFEVKHSPAVPTRGDLLVAVCNKSSKGRGLLNQLEEVASGIGQKTPVIVRSSGFPAGTKAKANLAVGRLVAKHNARRLVLE